MATAAKLVQNEQREPEKQSSTVCPPDMPAHHLNGKVERAVLQAARPKSSPELINRLDRQVVFHPMSQAEQDRLAHEERVRLENVRLEERARIARELHDTLLQSFVGASLQLGAVIKNLPRDSEIKSKLDPILEFMEQGIDEGRNVIQGLRLSGPHALDLVDALSAVQEEFSVQPGVDFRVSVFGQQQPLRSTIQQEIYRLGREALVNAFCHSRAKHIDLEFDYTDSSLTMRVCDNGCGIDPRVLDAGREGHWGLAGMRERASRIGGLLTISSSVTAGTEVRLSIPGGIAFQLFYS